MERLKVLIGRSSQCDYIIENATQHGTVSGKHATISEAEVLGTFLFEDHSTNGSYINGQLLHNNTCKISATDHITLGRTYVLPLADVIKRFFSSRPTTERKIEENRPKPYEGPYTKPQPPSSNDETSPLLHSSDVETSGKQSYDTTPSHDTNVTGAPVAKETTTIEKVPDWFWVLYGVSISIAIAVGYLIYEFI